MITDLNKAMSHDMDLINEAMAASESACDVLNAHGFEPEPVFVAPRPNCGEMHDSTRDGFVLDGLAIVFDPCHTPDQWMVVTCGRGDTLFHFVHLLTAAKVVLAIKGVTDWWADKPTRPFLPAIAQALVPLQEDLNLDQLKIEMDCAYLTRWTESIKKSPRYYPYEPNHLQEQ